MSSLRTRLALAMAAVVALTILLAAVATGPLLRASTEGAARQGLGREADLLARIPVAALGSGRAGQVAAGGDLQLGLVSRTGATAGAAQALTDPQLARLRAGQPVSTTGRLGDAEVIIEARPSRLGGAVVLAADAGTLDDTIARQRHRVLLALVLGLLGGLVVAGLVAGWIAKPLGAAASAEAGSPWRLGVLRVAALVAGVLLSAVGMLGVLAAQVLKAGISRQREFLADALAVQITRDRDGLGSALRRIAGEQQVPLRSDYASLVSHFLLVQPAGLRDWFDTHPTLAERIRRLYGRRMPALAPASGEVADVARIAPGDAGAAGAPGGIDDTLPFVNFTLSSSDPALAMAQPAAPGDGLATLPAAPADGQLTLGASALITQIRSASLGGESASRWLVALVSGHAFAEPDATLRVALHWLVSPAGASLRLPLLELLLARVRRWSSARRRELLDHCRRAVECDGHVHSAEWVYYTLARHRLLPNGAHLARQRRAPASKLAQSRALAALFAMAAAVGEASARTTRDALAEAATVLEVPPPASTPDEVGTTELALALDTLLRLPPLDKPVLLKALVGLARTPGDPNYDAFVRAVAAAIDCPAPRGAGRQIGARRGEPELAALV